MATNTKHFFLTGLILLLTICGNLSFAQEDERKHYRWKGFSFSYPDGWDIVLDKKVDAMKAVKLVGKRGPDQVDIVFSLMEEAPVGVINDEKYAEMPVLSSLAFGMSSALKLAGEEGEPAIATTYRSIELSSGPALSAVFTIMPPGANVYLLESFHQFSADKKQFFAGNLVTVSRRGGANTRPDYGRLIQEAYAVIRSAAWDSSR